MNSKGQTIIEMIVVITVGILVVGALTFATFFALRNVKFSQNQNQATKLAQEGLEKVKSIRDRDQPGSVYYVTDSSSPAKTKFSELWDINFICEANCYFYFNSSTLTGGTSASFENVASFKRQFKIEDGTPANQEKKVTVTVAWSDATGDHESQLTTILRRI